MHHPGRLLLLTLLLLALALPSPAAFATSDFVHPDVLPASAWQARWIGVAEAARPNQWTAFRREFELADVPPRTRLRIAADSKYWLWINGQLVVREGGLKRGPTPADTYCDEIELTGLWRPGRNTVAVLLWHFGRHGFSHNDSGESGLLLQLDDASEPAGSRPLLVSDGAWQARLHPAFGDTGEPHPNYRLPEANIRFDARADLPGWEQPDFAAPGWPAAVVKGRAGDAPWNALVRRPIPLWHDSDLRPYVTTRPLPGESDGGVWEGHLPANLQVLPAFEIEASAGLVVDVRTDNYEGGSATNVRTEYVTRAGRQFFETPGWMNGHAVHYRFPAGVRVIGVSYRETGYATDLAAGTFESDDPFFQRFREKAVRTLHLTMRDTYMDCPDRERAQWWGDVVLELGEAFYALDRRADALARKGILELAGWQKPDGILFSPIPAGNWDKDLPLQMLASVGYYGFWTYALHSGDLDTMAVVYPAVRRYLERFPVAPSGLVTAWPGGWPWGDWGENVDMEVLTQAWYHLALRGLREMAVATNRPEDLPWIDGRAAALAPAFQRAFWTGTEFRGHTYTGATDDRANALAVVAGLARPEQFPAVLRVLREQAHASPYMEKYVLEALLMMGEVAVAEERFRRRYAAMVEHPTLTTLWEGWGIGKEGYGGGTINHAWSGGPLTLMSQYFAGVAPTQPGYTRFHVLPQPGSLRQIKARVPSVRGNIEVALRRDGSSVVLTVNVPAATEAVVGVPVEREAELVQVDLNGQRLWPAAGATVPAGVAVLGLQGEVVRHFCVQVGPGTWTLRGQTAPLGAVP